MKEYQPYNPSRAKRKERSKVIMFNVVAVIIFLLIAGIAGRGTYPF